MTIPDLAVWAVEVTERREEEMSTEEITPDMLRSAYLAIHEVQDEESLPVALHEGLSNARIICALLYPTVIGCRPGEDHETMKRLGS